MNPSPAATHPPIDVAELYRQHGGLVWRRVRGFYGANEAEEVVAEVFLRVTEQAHTWRGEASAVTWLYQVATRHCLSRRRNERRRHELMDLHGQPAWSAPVSTACQETLTFLAQLGAEIDDELVVVATLFYRDGLTHNAIASIVGVSRRTVGNRLTELTELAKRMSEPTPREDP